jgi:hypothetical protein
MLINQVHAGQNRGLGGRTLIELAVNLTHLPVDNARDFPDVFAFTVGSNIVVTAENANDN